jgi:endonuclease/exonuclease/phosphatase (EEP) superfamily protein YafD
MDLDTAPPRPGRRGLPSRTACCWLLVLPGIAWAVIRTGGLERGPLVQLLAFTPYAAAWTLVPVAAALALRRWWAAGVALLAAVALAAATVPRVLPDGAGAGSDRTLRVLTANVLGGAGDPAALVALVRTHRVDVLAVQEFATGTEAGLDRLGLGRLLPYRRLNATDDASGSALYSRFPLGNSGVRTNRGGFTQAYGTILVPGGPPVLVESVHPMSPYALSTLPAWRADLRAEPPATPGGPLRILAGDFNATLDHAPLRALLATGYADAADSAGAGLAGTWGPYDGDLIPPVTIDHVLVDRRIAVRRVSVHRAAGSDHRPLLAELSLPRA